MTAPAPAPWSPFTVAASAKVGVQGWFDECPIGQKPDGNGGCINDDDSWFGDSPDDGGGSTDNGGSTGGTDYGATMANGIAAGWSPEQVAEALGVSGCQWALQNYCKGTILGMAWVDESNPTSWGYRFCDAAFRKVYGTSPQDPPTPGNTPAPGPNDCPAGTKWVNDIVGCQRDDWGKACDGGNGWVDINGNCVPCGPGNVYDEASETCIPNPNSSQPSTTPPLSDADCVEEFGSGYFSYLNPQDGLRYCAKCDYKNEVFDPSGYCVCGPGFKRANPNDASSQCIPVNSSSGSKPTGNGTGPTPCGTDSVFDATTGTCVPKDSATGEKKESNLLWWVLGGAALAIGTGAVVYKVRQNRAEEGVGGDAPAGEQLDADGFAPPGQTQTMRAMNPVKSSNPTSLPNVTFHQAAHLLPRSY